MKEILILGTGKMARNIGLFFLRNGCRVSWTSRDSARIESFASRIQKDIRRLTLILDKTINDFSSHICEISKIPKLKYDLILESINEDLTQKQEVIEYVIPFLESDTILASNSSSILPDQSHESAIGLHFFYPIELTGLVEVITNKYIHSEKITTLINKLKSWGIYPIHQNKHNAFAVNRLLLPMQAEAFRLLYNGYPPDLVNDSSKSDLLAVGQLDLMDNIGLDVLLPAIKNYISRMSDEDQNKFDPLIDGLDVLIEKGKFGKKNRDGILIGDSLPWQSIDLLPEKSDQLKERFSDIFINTCHCFVKENQLKKVELDHVLKSQFS